MKNVIVSFFLFIGLLVGIGFSVNYLTSVCSTLLEENNQLEDTIKNEDWKNGYSTSVDLLNQWKKEYNILTIFVHHEKIDALNNELLQLTQYIQCKEKGESLAKIHVIKTYLQNIIESEKINIQNIF